VRTMRRSILTALFGVAVVGAVVSGQTQPPPEQKRTTGTLPIFTGKAALIRVTSSTSRRKC